MDVIVDNSLIQHLGSEVAITMPFEPNILILKQYHHSVSILNRRWLSKTWLPVWLTFYPLTKLGFGITMVKVEIRDCVPKNHLWMYLYVRFDGTNWISEPCVIEPLAIVEYCLSNSGCHIKFNLWYIYIILRPDL